MPVLTLTYASSATAVLPLRVQELVKLIFDKEMMKKALQSLDVDIRT
jgi:hypothetical protein